MAANDTRIIGIEVQGNIAALKTAVDALQVAVDAINTAAAAWVLNDVDGSLPTDVAVKAQVAAYNALSTTIIKPATSLNDSLAVVNAAE